MSEGFFERWARRKQKVKEGEVVPDEPTAAPPEALPVAGAERAQPDLPSHGEAAVPPPPTLDDARALTPDSDFKPFLAANVAPEVKNAALKKLFADPHFNVMDGLDTYIDDYSVSTPVPESVLRQMASAKFMKLFDEQTDKDPEADASADVAESVSTDPVPSQPVVADAQPARQETDDHHADLRLQQDDAARAEDPRRGAV